MLGVILGFLWGRSDPLSVGTSGKILHPFSVRIALLLFPESDQTCRNGCLLFGEGVSLLLLIRAPWGRVSPINCQDNFDNLRAS